MKLAATAVLVVILAWTAAPAVAAPPTVPVVPSALPDGPALRVPSIDPATHVLTRPGRTPVTVLPTRGWATTLLRVRGGYLVSIWLTGRTYRLVLVRDDGTQRVVRNRWSFEPKMVAGDGRTLIAVQHRLQRRGVSEAYVVRRFRVQDGRAVGKPLLRPFRDLAPRPLVVTPATVTLTSPHRVGRRNVETRTEQWNTRTGRVRVISKRLNSTAHDDALLSWAASRRAHVVGVERGLRQVALDSRTRTPLWRTRAGEVLLQFAPDDRTVATVSEPMIVEQGTIGAVQRISVRSARSGRLRVDFTGHFAFRSGALPSAEGLEWETPDAFIAYAYDGVLVEDDYTTFVGPGLVRCRISTASCRRIADHRVVLMQRRSH